jgi:hypothetical protein
MVGYSGTPLAAKLGIRPGDRVGVLHDPGHFADLVDPLPAGATIVNRPRAACEVVVLFCADRAVFTDRLPAVLAMLPADGAVWVSWPKKSSPLHVDMTEDTVREIALPLGVVDNKVCAIDEDWSGLRLVVRRENRKDWANG